MYSFDATSAVQTTNEGLHHGGKARIDGSGVRSAEKDRCRTEFVGMEFPFMTSQRRLAKGTPPVVITTE